MKAKKWTGEGISLLCSKVSAISSNFFGRLYNTFYISNKKETTDWFAPKTELSEFLKDLFVEINVLYLQFPCSRFGIAPCCFVSFEKRKTLLKLFWLILLEYISVSHYSLCCCHCWMFIINPTSADQFHHLYLSFYFIWIFQHWEHCQFVFLK